MISVIDCHDRYEIVRLIAEGGMGAVFEAKKIGEAGFEKVVALKMLLPKFQAKINDLTMELEEADTLEVLEVQRLIFMVVLEDHHSFQDIVDAMQLITQLLTKIILS